MGKNDEARASGKISRRLRRLGIVALISAAAGYILVLSAAYCFQRKLTYFPAALPEEEAVLGASDRGVSEVLIGTADGQKLHGVFKPPAGGAFTVLYLHGNAHNLTDRMPLFRELTGLGYGCLLIDYRGFGRSSGSPTEKGLYEDARASMAWLEARGVPAERVILFGESLGTGVAVETARSHAVAGIVLQSPYTSIPDVGGHHFKILPAWLLMHDRYDSLSKAGEIRCPVLAIWADKDMVVPPRFSEKMFESLPGPKRKLVLPGAEHFDVIGLDREAYLAAWQGFVEALAGRSAGDAPGSGPGQNGR